MLKNIPLTDGQLVISKDACPFQEVLDGFPDAGYISVVTFNISWSHDRVLGALKKARARQRLITNIRARRDRYRKGKAGEAAEMIRQYMSRLDPAHFGLLARISFCFENHAKIVKTDKIAYVGSANFSDESQGNWEAGVILRDPAVLTALEEEIDKLEKKSIRYYGGDMDQVVPPILAAREELGEALDEFSSWPTKENRKAFIKTLNGIDRSFKDIDFTWPLSFARIGPLSSLVDREVLQRIGSKLRDFDHIDEMIRKAEAGEIDAGEVEVNNDGDIPDWGFESVIDSMNDQRDDEIMAIRRYVKDFIAQIESACFQISNNIAAIDNTTQ